MTSPFDRPRTRIYAAPAMGGRCVRPAHALAERIALRIAEGAPPRIRPDLAGNPLFRPPRPQAEGDTKKKKKGSGSGPDAAPDDDPLKFEL